MSGGARPVAEMVATAISAIRKEGDRQEENRNSADEFDIGPHSSSDLYKRTVRTFSPRRQGRQGAKRPKGRPATSVRMRMFILDGPMEKLPSTRYRKRLTEGGLGSPKNPSSWTFQKSWSVALLKNHIVSVYPGVPLGPVGFYVGKCTKSRDFVRLEIDTVSQLKKEVGKGVLFIIPKREISMQQEKCDYPGGTVTVGDVLKFVTGCSRVPPGGFETGFKIDFTEDVRYPAASTCTFTLTLPLNLHTYKRLKEVMIESIVSGPGFGNV